MSAWSVYSLETGLFTGQRFACPDSMVEANTPQGCGVIAGRHDKLSQRVDVATGTVVAYERPAAEIEAEQIAARDRQARRRIAELEAQQARRVRELLAETDPRLRAIDDEIAGLRGVLARVPAP